MDDDQQFCLRWNNHQSTLISVFDTLLENETLVDCTLAAEGKFLKAHKVVLSACSPYFATLLQEQYDKHPIFILKDVKYQELRAMMDYMYRGEVNISQDQLAALLKAAESLQIKGLSDNRSGGNSGASGNTAAAAQAAAQQATKSDAHHRVKLSGTYTLEQTKRSRGAMDVSGDVSGSREGSSSPSRRRRKVRRRSMENDMHDNSNSSVLQAVAAASNQSILQQTSASLAASALVSTQLASGSSVGAAAAATNASGSSSIQVSTQPLTSSSSNVTKKTESAKLTSTAAQGAQQQQQQQQQQTTSDAINTDNVQQQQQQQQNESTQGEADEMDVASGGAGVASGAVAVHPGVVKQLATLDKSNHKQKIKDNSITTTATTEMVIEPKAEYDEDAHDENVEDLTLDEEDMTMEELDQAAGTSQGGDGSSQAYATWQHDRSQDELGLMAAQDAQQRDPQDLSITRIAGLTWNEWNARLAMPLVTLREGVQPLIFPTDLSVDKQLSIAGNKGTTSAATSADSIASEHKPPVNSIRLKIELGAAGTTPLRSSSSENQHKNYPGGGGKLKHLSEEEATALMLKAVAEKRAAAAFSSNSSDRGYGDENPSSATVAAAAAGGNSNDYPATLSGAVTFADVGGPAAGLCHINILNSISAMNNLISGNTSAAAGGGNSNSAGGGAGGSLNVSLNSSAGGSNNNSLDNGAGHPCPVCGRVYKLKSSLRNHQKWECGKEPQFQCPFCVYRAKQKMHIGRHMERMHKEKFQLEDDKSFIASIIGSSAVGGGSNSGGGGAVGGGMDTESGNAAAAVAAAATAVAFPGVPKLETHFS
ncbi:longitudinals lacking protein, isoforms A/B/D/L isoform X4 [Drosophila albomicans]|uniref:Longitudinals lacking protein, isoforms A/B/D/L isoform X4 n=1 Tax=Drosophila albomicans TaxID=7291 RepID=A0A6P8X2W4_DROAB|nr:longitudinals lacking protein, isoforms A/B/D/L isoform X4 [Drosophila albomicans]